MKTALVVHSSRDANYLGILRQQLGALGINRVISTTNKSPSAINMRAETHKANYILIADTEAMGKVVNTELTRASKVDPEMWAGSVMSWKEGFTIPTMFILPLHYLHTKPWGNFVMNQHLTKFLTPHSITPLPEGEEYVKVTPSNYLDCLEQLSQCTLIAVDIETVNHITMDMVGYCGKKPSGEIVSYIVYLGLEASEESFTFVRKANLTKPVKVMHNGTYDNQFFARYQCPVQNYILDTEYLFYSAYSELPKSLAFVSAFYNPIARYWKQLVDVNRAKYCALDCYNTLVTAELMMEQLPEYAWTNYSQLFPLTTVVLYFAMHGIKADAAQLTKLKLDAEEELDRATKEFHTMCGGEEVNYSSPKQIKSLFYDVLKARPVKVKHIVKGTDATTLAALAEQHPLIGKFVDTITHLRKTRKAISTYYSAPLYHNRLLYSYRIDGTETGRLSCSKSNFGWGNKNTESYGSQIQNIPSYMKSALIPDTGYTLGESDKSQSEARCVGYIAKEPKLIAALESEDDFYLICANLFFGLPMDKAKPIRQLVKKIIHGSNYCMGANTFIDSVRKDFGVTMLRDAQRFLDRRTSEDLITFAAYLLSLYRKTYDRLPSWYDETKMQLITTGKLVSPMGWTRRFFGDPYNNNTLRGAIAHAPQNLSVSVINKALIKAFWQLQVPSNGEFMLICQVHDSIVYQAIDSKAQEYKDKLNNIMDIAVPFKFSPNHDMRIPTDGNLGSCWKECH